MLIEALALTSLIRGLRCEPVGPVARADEVKRIARNEHVDAAVLDVNLSGDLVFEAAADLAERDIPLLFVSGYDGERFPPRFRDMARLDKPYAQHQLEAKLLEILGETSALGRV